MKTWAITGGIACGKGTVSASLAKECGPQSVAVFDCDRAVHELLDRAEIVQDLQSRTTAGILDGEGRLDRVRMRDAVFSDETFRREVESVLHPLVRDRASDFLEESANRTECRLAVVEVPLLFESGFPIGRDGVIGVGASREMQTRRICENRQIDRETAERMIDSQMSVEEKMDRSDYVIWNDGSLAALTGQVSRLVLRHLPNS